MKKLFTLLTMLTAISLGGCTQEEQAPKSSSSLDGGAPTYSKIDYDFTTKDETYVQSLYFSMESYPSDYINKVVKVKGPFSPYESSDPNSCYPAIFLFKDSTGCCDYCLEFLLYDVPVCPYAGGNGYPLLNEEATIVGRFDKYLEGSTVYIHLVDALWLK